jgi:Zn-dependent protease with chaperone function
MSITRQRFFGMLAALITAQSLLALAVAVPLLLDVSTEALHTVWQVCQHPFRAHYAQPVTLGGIVVTVVVLTGFARFLHAGYATFRRTRSAVSVLMVSPRPQYPARARDIATRSGVRSPVEVLDLSEPLAFCHGFCRPRIYVTSGLCSLLSDTELSAVLLHEDYHRRRREPLRLLLLSALVQTLRFWPALGPRMTEARTEMEVSADIYATARSGSARSLARALLKVLEQTTPGRAFADESLALSPLSPTEARIECLTRAQSQPYPPLSWRSIGWPGLALLGVSAGLFALAEFSNLHPILHPCHRL